MTFIEAIKSGFANYVTFSGRAQRSAFWYWVLFSFLGGLVTAGIDVGIVGMESTFSPLNTIFSLGTLLPSLAVGARRLHDIGRTGWWQLLHLVILIGTIILIVWFCQRGEPGTNKYGPNPLGE